MAITVSASELFFLAAMILIIYITNIQLIVTKLFH